MTASPANRALDHARDLHNQLIALASRPWMADTLAALARLTLAGIFWRSMLTKVETVRALAYTDTVNGHEVIRHHLRLPAFPLEMKPSTHTLFSQDYALPLLPPELAAWLATLAEFSLPIALVLGVFTRLSALALVGMTLVIQIFVYPEAWWSTHALWMTIALGIAAHGPGRFSLDTLLGARLGAPRSAA